MSETKTIIDKVKSLIFEEDIVEVVEEAKFLDATTTDGITLKITGETLEVGASVSIVSEDGEEVSGEATYQLEDGTTITVDGEGNISDVANEVEPEAEEVEEAAMEEEVVNPLEEKVTNLESKLDELLAKFSIVEELKTKVEEFSKLPAEEEVVVKKKDVRVSKKHDAIEALSKFRNNK